MDLAIVKGRIARRMTAALVTAVIVFSAVGIWRYYAGRAVPQAGIRMMPPFALRDYAGQEVTETAVAGAPALIAIWTSWCAHCEDLLDAMEGVAEKFGDRLKIVAINRAESRETAMRASGAQSQATSTLFLLDPDDSYYRVIGGFAMPEILLIDRAGAIRFHKRGPVGREELHRMIGDVVAE